MPETLPTFGQIMELPALVEASVEPEFIDDNGHMNVGHYLDLGTRSTIVLCEQLGIDDAYRGERRMGVFTSEHHLRYYSEMHRGEKISVHTRVLGRAEKVTHMMSFLLDRTHERLANTLELILVHVDLDTRRPTAIPGDIAAALDKTVATGAGLTWQAPMCGVMGIRR